MCLPVDSARRGQRHLPAVMSYEEADLSVEEVMAHYTGVRVSMDTHNRTIADIYGEQHRGVDPAVQIADLGRLVAVLFWKLAVARGVINPHATAP